MKIAIIGSAYPYRGGLAAYNERLAIEFQNKNHETNLFTFTLQYPKFLFPGKSQYLKESPPKNISITRCINSINPINWIKIGNQLKKEKPDLVIIKFWLPFMGPCFGTILRKIKKNNHSKIISIIDNIIPHESRPGDKIFTNYFIKPVDIFLAMSQNVLDDIKKIDATKPKILSPHPLFDNFGPSVSQQEALKYLNLNPKFRYILFFGLIRKYKGLDLLIEAFSNNHFKNKNIKLIIAGEYYSDKNIYSDLIKKYHLENTIIQIDKFIPDSEVKYFFGATDLVVQPYKSATQSGITQIAYHFNKPMIVTDVGGLAELCPNEKVGYVVPVNSKALASAILNFFNTSVQKTFIENIKQEKKKYSWDILTNNILKSFSEIKK